MKPVIKEYKVVAPHYIQMLSQWRKDNPIISLGAFEITDSRTERWLDNLVIGRDDRILFILEDLEGLEIGHLGYSSFDYSRKECEIDKVLRAVKAVVPGVMHFAMESLLYWGMSDLKLERIILKVLSDNHHAIKFYESLGFSYIGTIPLYKRRLSDETRWEEIPECEGQQPGKFYSVMLFDKSHLKSYLKRLS